MKIFLSRALALASLTLLIIGCQQKEMEGEENYVVMLSLDGFRWDYPDLYNTPNIDELQQDGVKAVSLIPSFPTKTFPNHYTLVTGLYPDNHGIVGNGFYDPELDADYSISNRNTVSDGRFYNGEPIWNTAEKQGIKAASYFWVGSEADIQEIRPTYWKEYDHNLPFSARVDSVIGWLQLPETLRPRLITFYYHEPDSKGHSYGPASSEVKEEVEFLDSMVGVFHNKLKTLDIYPQINFILTSDHGMCQSKPEMTTDLLEYIDTALLEKISGSNPVYNLKAYDGMLEKLGMQLEVIPHLNGWRPHEVPQHLHFGNNIRALDFVLVADSGWSIVWGADEDYIGGLHGYDNRNTDMHTIFYGIGPSLKQNHLHPSFENIHIYSLVAHLLGIKPAPNDGNLDNVQEMIKD